MSPMTQSQIGHNCKRRTKGKPNDIDLHVGKQLRKIRLLCGVSQEKLAAAVGLTFQQIQKYERGVNRISSGKLYEFARLFDLDVSYFYQGLPETSSCPTGKKKLPALDILTDKVVLAVAKDIFEMRKLDPELATDMKEVVRGSLHYLRKQKNISMTGR